MAHLLGLSSLFPAKERGRILQSQPAGLARLGTVPSPWEGRAGFTPGRRCQEKGCGPGAGKIFWDGLKRSPASGKAEIAAREQGKA